MPTKTKDETTVRINGGPAMSFEEFEARAGTVIEELFESRRTSIVEFERDDEALLRRAVEAMGKELLAVKKKLLKVAIVETKVDKRVDACGELRKRINTMYDPDAIEGRGFHGAARLTHEQQVALLTGIYLVIVGLYEQLEAMREEKLLAAYRDVARRINHFQHLADRISGQGELPLENGTTDEDDEDEE